MHHSDDSSERYDMETSNSNLQVQMCESQIKLDCDQFGDNEYKIALLQQYHLEEK